MRIGVLAGEASGDILGARVLQALGRHCGELTVEGIGGPLMQAQGLDSMFPMERLSVMGLVEPLRRLPELLRMRRAVYQHFRANPPDLFLGIDSPDFNLPLERKLRRCGVPTAHLVSPSVWAWRSGRIRKIKQAVDLMLCLFPFELDIYRRHGVPCCFVGHPLADEISPALDPTAARDALALAPPGSLLALLPGSREGEVALLGPLFLQVARLLMRSDPQLSFVIPAVDPARHAQLSQLLAAAPGLPVTLVQGRSRDVISAADAVLVASGTVTLEAALLKRPMVVAYRMGTLSWTLLSRMVTTPWVALPNILSAAPLVPELLQREATPRAVAAALEPLLTGSEVAARQLQGFEVIQRQLQRGYAERAAVALADLAAPMEGDTHG